MTPEPRPGAARPIRVSGVLLGVGVAAAGQALVSRISLALAARIPWWSSASDEVTAIAILLQLALAMPCVLIGVIWTFAPGRNRGFGLGLLGTWALGLVAAYAAWHIVTTPGQPAPSP